VRTVGGYEPGGGRKLHTAVVLIKNSDAPEFMVLDRSHRVRSGFYRGSKIAPVHTKRSSACFAGVGHVGRSAQDVASTGVPNGLNRFVWKPSGCYSSA